MTIQATDAIDVTVSDPSGLAVVVVFAEYDDLGRIDAVWNGSAFASDYGISTVSLPTISGVTYSAAFSLLRVTGWPADPRIRVVTVDLAGNLATVTASYALPAAEETPPILTPEGTTDGTGYALQPRAQTYADELPGYVMAQYYSQPVLTALLEGLLEAGQEIETAALQLRDQFNPRSAVGAFLTALGEDVGELRGGRSDAAYRPAVLARIAVNRSSGTPDEILDLARVLTGSTDDPIYLSDVGGSQGAQVRVEITAPWSDEQYDPPAVVTQLGRMRPAGVHLWVLYPGGEGLEDAFTFADELTVFDSGGRGFATDAHLLGGFLEAAREEG